jgi:hypothetical protein
MRLREAHDGGLYWSKYAAVRQRRCRPRPLIGREIAGAHMKLKRRSVERLIAADNESLHPFAPFRVGYADHRAFGDAVMGDSTSSTRAGMMLMPPEMIMSSRRPSR